MVEPSENTSESTVIIASEKNTLEQKIEHIEKKINTNLIIMLIWSLLLGILLIVLNVAVIKNSETNIKTTIEKAETDSGCNASGFSSSPVPIYKPAIYVYADESSENETQNYIVRLTSKQKLLTIYPDAEIKTDCNNTTYSWSVTIKQNANNIIVNGKEQNEEYDYLFWDAEYDESLYGEIGDDFEEGFCVKGSDTKEFLEKTLREIGLTDDELHEFIIYWLPSMIGNKYNLIRFDGLKQDDWYNNAFPLELLNESNEDVAEKLRICMVWKTSEHMTSIPPQKIQTFDRPTNSPYVVEWGGTKLP